MQLLAQGHILEEVLHHIEAVVDGRDILEWEKNPTAEQTSAHRAHCAVDNRKQAFAVLAHRIDKFEVSDGEFVETHIPLLLDTRESYNVRNLAVLGYVEIV